jgi:inner membrane protein
VRSARCARTRPGTPPPSVWSDDLDPVAHTLFGAALAESGLRHRTRHATATLLIGANLPDVDAIAGFWGSDFELLARRGHTHGVLAMLLLPLLLFGGVWLWNRWRTRDRGGGGGSGRDDGEAAPPFRPRTLLALAFLGVWSHPLLDLLNTYGVRLLMPFDGRWFYGDTLFIVDPWVWLLTAAGVVLARSQRRPAISGWTLLALLSSAVILGTNMVPVGVKIAWCVGLALIVTLRWRRPAWTTGGSLARTGLATLLLYVGAAYGLARLAESAVAERFAAARQVQANPSPGTPFTHRMVVVEDAAYRVITPDGVEHEVPRQSPDAIVQRALASPSIRGFVNWMRFPYWTVEESADSWTVRIRDLRYQGPDMEAPRGIGLAEVEVPKGSVPATAQ